jgi:hypothetical protein
MTAFDPLGAAARLSLDNRVAPRAGRPQFGSPRGQTRCEETALYIIYDLCDQIMYC